VWAPRLGAILFTAFGALAGLLTVIGLYGVISYSVGQRTRELGIRMALGAQPSAVLRQVLAEGAILVFWGLVLGLVATVTIAGVLKSLLFGVSARDPLTLARGGGGPVGDGVGGLRGAGPARHAHRSDGGAARRVT
jgi:ABC-type antimicrobial peptide transport system permease subunit